MIQLLYQALLLFHLAKRIDEISPVENVFKLTIGFPSLLSSILDQKLNLSRIS
jgi:hypothetical protein